MEPAYTSTKPSNSCFRKWPILWPMLISSGGEESYQTEDEQANAVDTISSPRADQAVEKMSLRRKLPSIVDIKKCIPPSCFKSSTPLSVYYMIRDFLIIVFLYILIEMTWQHLPYAVQLLVTPAYWLLQGTMLMAVFVVGHDAGHGSFSTSEMVNTICGNICHTIVCCPYYMWKLSHRNHHKHTGNIDKDEVFYPVREKDNTHTHMAPGFGLGIGWFLYLAHGYRHRVVQHFNPLDPMFHSHVINCTISLGCLICWWMLLARATESCGWTALCYHYLLPELIFGTYLVIITFLHHHSEGVPWYGDSVWNNVRGQLSTVDRSYGWCHYLIHNIGTHQIHHLFPKIPHYHLEAATESFRKAYPELVVVRNENILMAFYRMFQKFDRQSNIADNTLVHVYQ
ncbi:unnamed protein product [Candidula unifasciata]|uniref:Fatty acid desaturase domain-containing protein n=1 Tax=Candidula unifasciata TaxID=100452 RepID=A0A8S3YNJ7_9EUPU|nr:unnamed protein product [Candidula unifasciata]